MWIEEHVCKKKKGKSKVAVMGRLSKTFTIAYVPNDGRIFDSMRSISLAHRL